MVATIGITLACAYCYCEVHFRIGNIEVRDVRGNRLTRAGQFTTIICPHCDSRFSLHITSKRKSKGRRLKVDEAKRAAEHAELVRQAEARNEEIAKQLLAEPGCTCAQSKDTNYYSGRTDGLHNSGATRNNLPLPPVHRYSCPANPKNKEAA